MSLRNEQCNKACRILDDVLANRPTERDSLITAVRKAFGALETDPQWIPCSERLPEESGWYIVTVEDETDTHLRWFSTLHGFEWEEDNTIAWMPLPEPYRGEKK